MPAKIKFILNEPRNPKNIGASARGMANFGFRDLSVVKPYSVAWRETRSAVTAGPVVEKAKKFESLKAAIKTCHVVIGTSAGSRRAINDQWIGLDELHSIVKTSIKDNKTVGLLFGSERSGLSNEDLAFCHFVLRLPTVKECPSMNLSQAVAVVACALRQEQTTTPPTNQNKENKVSVQHLDILIKRAMKAFKAAGLQKNWNVKYGEARVRRSFFRWNLTPEEIAMLHGLFGFVLKRTAT